MNRIAYTDKQLSEQVGSEIATVALNNILNSPSQAKSLGILIEALENLQRLPHQSEATGGFAVALVATIERGLGGLTHE